MNMINDMTLRDYFAARAMAAFIAEPLNEGRLSMAWHLTSHLQLAAGPETIAHAAENCEPCCADCNYANRDMDKETFLNLIARIYAHQSR